MVASDPGCDELGQHRSGVGGVGQAQVPVVISADRNVKYDEVVKVMDTLQKAGVVRLGLSVQQGS
jgi:biopolymer transport protein ExbD